MRKNAHLLTPEMRKTAIDELRGYTDPRCVATSNPSYLAELIAEAIAEFDTPPALEVDHTT